MLGGHCKTKRGEEEKKEEKSGDRDRTGAGEQRK